MKNQIPNSFADDTNKYSYQKQIINLRLGWEFTEDLSKRFELFYGLDFKWNWFNLVDDASFYNGGYANGNSIQSQSLAMSLLMGFRFKINDRISLSTETNFGFYLQKEARRKYFQAVTHQFPAIDDLVTPTFYSSYTQYPAPVMLYLNIKL